MLLRKGILKICSKFTEEHPCQSVISIGIALRHGCSPVNLLHLFGTPFPNNLSYFTLFSSDFGFSVVDFEQVHVSWLPAALPNLILYCWCFPVNFAKIFSQIINRRGNIVMNDIKFKFKFYCKSITSGQIMMFSIKDFFSERIRSHLLKKSSRLL